MHLLYLDDAGSVSNSSDRHIVLAGLSLFERRVHWLSLELERLAKGLWPSSPETLEFRGVDIRSGRKQWRGITQDRRADAYKRALEIIGRANDVRLFGAAVHKLSVSPDDPMEHAFEQVCNRFDRMLGRLHKQNDTQRGIIILDKSSYETSLQGLANNFRVVGHRWGVLRNLAEVPLFVDSRATRMIQFADMIAYAIRRYIDSGDSALFDIIKGRFDSAGGVMHGLIHVRSQSLDCACFSCRQR
jgi:hypothetical protein